MQTRQVSNLPYRIARRKLMVKTIVSILVSLSLLIAAGIFEHFFVREQMHTFSIAVASLQEKVDNSQATLNDAQALQNMWDARKKVLHILIPHNTIANIDYWLGEATGCIEQNNFSEAFSKIQVLVSICKQIPDQFSVSIENIF